MHARQLETNLTAKKAEASAFFEKSCRAAEAENRELSADERGAVDRLVAEAREMEERLGRMKADASMADTIASIGAGVLGSPARPATTPAQPAVSQSMGAQFVQSADYRGFIERHGHRNSSQWTSGAIETYDPRRATTLDTTSGSGGPLILPDTRPGIIELPHARRVVADLIAPGTTASNLIQFMREKTFTNAADAVAQGGTKPESTLVFEAATSPVQKLAHWIPVTDEMLEDYAQTQSIIDARLRLGLDIKEEDELLNGTGISPHLLGINALTGLSAAVARGTDSSPDAILKQIAAIATATLLTPDGIVMNPANWLTIQLMKNAAGNYMGNGPWTAPQNTVLWGLPVAITPAQAANTATVGAFRQAAQVFRKGGVRIEATNSHSDFFTKNLVAIRGEERLALVVYREAAFGKVTGLN